MYNLTAIILPNCIGLILMIIILLSGHRESRPMLINQKLFFVLVGLTIWMLCLETISFCIDKQQFTGSIFLNRLINVILYACSSMPVFVWVLYVEQKIYNDEQRIKKNLPWLMLPLVIVVICSVITLFTDFLFKITPDNEYVRTKFTYISFIMSYLYLFYSVIVIVKNIKKLKKHVYISLLSFMAPPLIASVIQCFCYGLSLIWLGIAISLVIIFINLQNSILVTDGLTGLYNRRQLEHYLYNETKHKLNDGHLVGIMLDIDNFKSINDTYGHSVGDDALTNVGKILLDATPKNAFVARYAGDEFVIITKVNKIEEIDLIYQRIIDVTHNFNISSKKQYFLSFSMGYEIYKLDANYTLDQFFKNMDDNMYLDKNTKTAHQRKFFD